MASAHPPQHTYTHARTPGPLGLHPSHPAPAGSPVVPYSLGVGEWPKPVVVLLPSGVPQPQVDRLPVHHHIRRIVVKTAGNRVREIPPVSGFSGLHRPGALSAPRLTPEPRPGLLGPDLEAQGSPAHRHPYPPLASSGPARLLTRWGCTLQGRRWSCN